MTIISDRKTVSFASKSLASALAIAAGMAGFTGQAIAQEGETGDAGETEVRQLDTVMVTALRRETALEDTPLAIAAFGGEDLERIGADGLEEFLQFAPGVQFNRSSNGTQTIFVRGLSSTIGNTPVGFYIDEVPFTALSTTVTPDVRAWDLERVEVLRGPQGTLYGASSLGGTIRILTNDPVHNEFQAKVDGTYSSTESASENYGLKGMVNIPLVEDKLSLRIAATQEELSGWIDQDDTVLFGPTVEDSNDFDVSTVRAKLKFTPSDKLEFVLGYARTESDSGNGNFADDDGNSTNSLIPTTAIDVESDLFSAEINYDFGFATLTSSTSLFDFSTVSDFADYASLPGAPFFSTSDVELLTQEVRLVSNGDGAFSWIVGGIYTENETATSTFFVLPPTLTLDSQQLQNSEFLRDLWRRYLSVDRYLGCDGRASLL